MKKMARALFLIFALILAVGLALPQAAPPASAGNSVEVQLGIILDGSDSISSANWTTTVNGLAAAIEGNSCPKDGSVEITFVQIGGTTAQLEIGPVVVNSSNAVPPGSSTLGNQIRSISQIGGTTPLACGIYKLAGTWLGVVEELEVSPTMDKGDWLAGSNAYDDEGGYARGYNGDEHLYYDYAFSVPIGATIDGIVVRLDAKRQSEESGSIDVELSWDYDGATGNWTSTGYDKRPLGVDDRTRYAGGLCDNWGRTWTPSEINSGLGVRVTANATGWVDLDWIPVTVYYHEPGYDPNLVQMINIVTDGEPNTCCQAYTGAYCGYASGKASAVAARNCLINKLQINLDPRDRINSEGVGILQPQIDWLRDSIVFPQPGKEAPPYPNEYGWVIPVGNYTELADAFEQKFEIATLKLDFGDAPDTYNTTLAKDGARHAIPSDESTHIWLGDDIDTESDGQPHPLTDGDDEDGVVFLGSGPSSGGPYSHPDYFEPGQYGAVEITVSGNVSYAYLHGWIDWNQDGDWDDTDENVFCSYYVGATGNYTIDFPVPTDAEPGLTWARFRLDDYEVGLNSPQGLASNGEVEDYPVQLGKPEPDLTLNKKWRDLNGAPAKPGDIIEYTIEYSNKGKAYAADIYLEDDYDETAFSSIGNFQQAGGHFGISPDDDGSRLRWPDVSGNVTLPPGASGNVIYEATLNDYFEMEDCNCTVPIENVATIYCIWNKPPSLQANATVPVELGPFDLTVISDGCCNVTVQWGEPRGTLPRGTVPAGGSDTFTIDCGITVNLEAIANDPCIFNNWTGNVNDTASPVTFITMCGDETVTAHCSQPTPTPPPIIGGGGGGGWDMCPEKFTVNFNGKITETTMTYDGRLCGNCYAANPTGEHLFEIDSFTRVLDSKGDPVNLIDITEVHSPPLPPYTVLVGNMYDFAPSGVTFDKQVRLTLGYNVDQLPADALRVLMAFYGIEEVWTEIDDVETTQVADIGSLTGFFNHLTIFATLAEVAEVPRLEVSNLSIAPSRREIWPFLNFAVVTGEEAVVSVDVANVGNQEASHTVILQVNGETKTNHDVNLTPGQSSEVTFVLSDNEPGHNVVVVEELTGEFTHSLWINWALIIGLGAALLIIIVLAFFGVRWYLRRGVA